MSLQRPRLAYVTRCAYQPRVGELTPNKQGLTECPVCGVWGKVTKRARSGRISDYREYARRNQARGAV